MKTNRAILLIVIAALFLSGASARGEQNEIKLPPPNMEGGVPLMQALKMRSTSRSFSEKELPVEVLSNLLWAAFGVNRPESGKRTAPSAVNWQEMDIYVAMKDGLYIYDAQEHSLKLKLEEDIRAATGVQAMAKTAPVNLVYVADFSKMKQGTKDDRIFYSAADTGFISQNVYLFCASEGLSTFVRGLIDKPALEKKMGLRKDQKVTLAQSVGYTAD